MSASKKALRQQPSRDMDKYTLTKTYVPGSGLMRVSNDLFKSCGKPDGSWLDPTVENNYTSDLIDIGFAFEFDGIKHTKFVVSKNGWIALIDPTINTFTPNDIFSSTSTEYNIYITTGINTGTPINKHVLLAPWYDELRTMAKDAFSRTDLSGYSNYNMTKKDRVTWGLEPRSPVINSRSSGVRYYLGESSLGGKYLVVRWGVVNVGLGPDAALQFDVVLYESGKIEFRYENRDFLQLKYQVYSTEPWGSGATIGVFHSKTKYRFRDFSYELGYKTDVRSRFKYGGATYDAGFIDLTQSGITPYYGCRLTTYDHWPGRDKEGCILTFSPPVNTHRSLPRLDLKANDARISLPTIAGGPSRFDDNKSVPYVSTTINATSRLPRFHADSSDGAILQRLGYHANDVEIVAPVSKAAVDDLLLSRDLGTTSPFNENKRYENDPANVTDPFFSVGSRPEDVGMGFDQSLRSKTQIKLSFPINHNTAMLPTSSVMYYYNKRTGGWNIPTNSGYTTDNSGNPIGTVKNDIIYDQRFFVENFRVPEDQIGFGPVGNFVASGTVDVGNAYSLYSDPMIGADFSFQNVQNAIYKQYGKSITNNQNYNATSNEVFSLPIKQPFLVEKAIIEIPIAVGDGWFNDKTQTKKAFNKAFDFGGPGITVSLQNELSNGSNKIRDIIFSGTFTHTQDLASFLASEPIFGPMNQIGFNQGGFINCGGTPAGIIAPTTIIKQTIPGEFSTYLEYTGSVVLKCIPSVSNGVFVNLPYYGEGSTAQDAAVEIFKQKTISLQAWTGNSGIQYISPACRNKNGKNPSGRSLFNKEFSVENSIDIISNPFYSPDINSLVGFDNISLTGIYGYMTHRISPYVIRPNDNLILTISKTRPVLSFVNDGSEPYTWSDRQHDIQLITGSVNITLYGSYVQDGHEYHEPLSQPLSSDAIHEIVIGNEPVLDQFENEYAGSYYGGYYDDVIAGDLVRKKTVDNQVVPEIVPGGRGRIFSKLNSNSAPYAPGASSFDYSKLLSYTSKPFYKKSGLLLWSGQDDSERYYDSMMPSFSDILDAKNIKKSAFSYFDVDNITIKYVKNNILFIDSYSNSLYKLFPFEPILSNLKRNVSFDKINYVNGYYNAVGAWVQYSNPVEASKVIISDGFWWSDYDNPPLNLSVTEDFGVGLSFVDASKMMFGLGDVTQKSYIKYDDLGSSVITLSTNYENEKKADVTVVDNVHGYTYGYVLTSPVIRCWRYGVYSGLPSYSRAHFRKDRYGHFRDMLEQRPFTVFHNSDKSSVGESVVSVRFVDKVTNVAVNPAETYSQNLSFAVTSSLPYFDGETRNRVGLPSGAETFSLGGE